MNIQIKTKGFKEAQKFLKDSAAILAGTRGQFYPKQSKIIKKAIEQNADPSYQNSPAKEMAIKSADTWEHSGKTHRNRIMSTLYANYRQYGCGGLKITLLVDITESNQKEMLNAAIQELSDI